MRFDHIAGIVLVGWYLVIPPMEGTRQHPTFDTKAPLSHWPVFKSFDSAQQCETALDQYSELEPQIPAHLHRQGEDSDNLDYIEVMRMAERVTLGQCIASDDPRLAK
jgi:hypothetical protein